MSIAQSYLAKMMMQDSQKQSPEQIFRQETATIREQARLGKDMLLTLQKMRNINKYGNLGSSVIPSILQKFGVDFPSLFTTDAQVFEKLSNDMTKNVKAFFGTRLSESMINIFLKTVPTRTMTKEGRQQVIDSLMEMAKPTQQRYNALKRIIGNNGGRLPENFQYLMDLQEDKIQTAAEKRIARFVAGEDLDKMDEEVDGSDIPYNASDFSDGYVLADKNLKDKKGNQAYLVSEKGKWVPTSEKKVLEGMQQEEPQEKGLPETEGEEEQEGML